MREYIETEVTTPFPEKPVALNVMIAIAPDSRRVITTCACNGAFASTDITDLINECEWECLFNSILGAIEGAIEQAN